MLKMLAIKPTYYRSARVREGDIFEVDSEEHVRFFEARGEARQVFLTTEDVITAETVEIKRPRGRPPKNKVMEPASGDTYNTK